MNIIKRNDNKYSRFWLGNNAFEYQPSDKNIWDTDKLIKLASFKRAVANFVRIVTGKVIPVVYNTGTKSFTDGSTVVISAKLEHNQFDTAVGLALHEATHCIKTDFELHSYMKIFQDALVAVVRRPAAAINESETEMYSRIKKDVEGALLWASHSTTLGKIGEYIELISSNTDYERLCRIVIRLEKLHTTYYSLNDKLWDMSKQLENWVEDRRIDYFQCTTSPGYKGYYNALYQTYFWSKLISKAIRAKNYARTETLDSYMFRVINLLHPDRDLNALRGLKEIWDIVDINNINRLKSTLDSWNVGYRILDVILNYIEADSKQNNSTASKKSPPKVQPELPPESPTYDEDVADDTEDDDGENEPGSGNDESDSGQNRKDNDTGDDNYDSTSRSGSEGKKENDKETNKETDKENGEETDKETDKEDGEETGEKTNKNNSEEASDKEETGPTLSDREKKKMSTECNRQTTFLNNDVNKKAVTTAETAIIDAVNESGVVIKEFGSSLTGIFANFPKLQCILIKKVTLELISSGVFNTLFFSGLSSRTQLHQTFVNKGISLGTLLGKRLKTRNESKTTTINRLKTGKIDKRLLASLGFENERVFQKTHTEKYMPMAVHISLDASGSMVVGDKWNNTLVLVVALIKALSMTDNVDVVVSVRGNDGFDSNDMQTNRISRRPVVAIVYDSRVDKLSKVLSLFQYIRPGSDTPDGLAFEPIISELVPGKPGELESIFINVSDGQPSFSIDTTENGLIRTLNYSGTPAAMHTAKMVQKIRALNIKVLSYFLTSVSKSETNEDWPIFKLEFGKDANYIDTNNVVELAKTLNSKFLEK
jgi:hypothetical protein